jgi:hypothetical protein
METVMVWPKVIPFFFEFNIKKLYFWVEIRCKIGGCIPEPQKASQEIKLTKDIF